MKTALSLILIFLFAFHASGQIDQEKAMYLIKVEKYSRMKRTGEVLTLGGSVLMVVGMVTLMNVEYTTTTNGSGQTSTVSDGNLGAGLLAYLGGAAAIGTGIPLWIVGGVNKGKYERKLNAVTLRLNASPQRAGLTLAYKF